MNTHQPSKPITNSKKKITLGTTSKRYSSLRDSDTVDNQRYNPNKEEFSTPNNINSSENIFELIQKESVKKASRKRKTQKPKAKDQSPFSRGKDAQNPSPIYSKIQLGIASLKQQRSLSKGKQGQAVSLKKKPKKPLGTHSSKNLHSKSFLSPNGKSTTPKASSSSKMKKRNIFASNPRLYQDLSNKQKKKIDLPKRICSTLNQNYRKASKTPTRTNAKRSTKELLKKYGRAVDSANISVISGGKLAQDSKARLTPAISNFSVNQKNQGLGKQEKLELEKKNYELLNQIKSLQ